MSRNGIPKLLALLLLVIPATIKADQYGDFSYSTVGTNVTITGYTGPGGTITIPNTISNMPVTSIGDRAFYNKVNVTNVIIPDKVISIGTSAFYQCNNMTNVLIGNGVASIDVWCFEFCTSLTNIVIPNGVTNIADGAFAYCSGLTNATIGRGLTSIANGEFFLCTNLTAIVVDALNSSFSSVDGVLFNKDQTVLIECPAGKGGSYSIPDGVINVGVDAFEYCGYLTNVAFPDSVANIGDGAFYRCAKLTSPTLSSNLTSIGNWAFQYCGGLTTITIPDSVTNIGISAFSYCFNLTEITVAPLNHIYSSADGVLFDEDQTTLIQFPPGRGGSYVIPNNVRNIGEDAFYGCRNLFSVSIPGNVTNIGDYAFYQCTSLMNIALPNLTTIAPGTFDYCTALRSVIIPDSVTNLGQFAFCACDGLTNVTIGSNVASIGPSCFTGCSGLKYITIPNSVTNIGSYAFYGSALQSVYFRGNAPTPTNDTSVFLGDSYATAYYLPGATGWGSTFDGIAAVLWNPQTQTGDGRFGVGANGFGFNITGTTNIPLVVEATTNLAGAPWTVLQSCTLTNGSVYFSDPDWTNYPSRFYRIRSP
jgi:BspA type Leucine rich repeat region (6 copies)